ncbi:MAG: DUF721 domain-containing protein [Planctomycetota bacterium]|nr:DUF721 domain-containing protein [Planctomycetota bacterium]MDP6988953.1 DUF721 domain-containing protein [Planctomycetota bacterium]
MATTKNPRRGPIALGDAVSAYLTESGLARRLKDAAVLEAWRSVLGEELGERARAVGFSRGELCVEVESAAHLHELRNYTGEKFREEANRLLGEARILRLALKLKR